MILETKRCGTCKTEKPLSDFGSSKWTCKACVNEHSRKWRARHPEQRAEIVRESNAKRQQVKREWNQRQNLGTVIEKDRCAICETEDGGRFGLVVHHEDGCNGRGDKPLNNDPSNLVVLCRSCHVKVHNRWGLKRLEEVVELGM